MVRWFFSAASFLLFLPPLLISALVAPTAARKMLGGWGRLQLKIFGISLSIVDENRGQYQKGPYLYLLLNQTSLVETWVMLASIPTPYQVFMNVEFALLPVGWVLWLLGSVVIVREWPNQAKRGVDRATQKMKVGENFYMSIEGKRSPNGKLGPYKKGAAVLAINSGATIIPVVMRGAYARLPYGEWHVRPGRMEVVFCKAISTMGLGLDNRDLLTERLRDLAKSKV